MRVSRESENIRLTRAAPLFAALGDEVRLQLLARLAQGGPLSISRLTKGTRITRQAITKHLQVLEAAGLTKSARQGREQLWITDPSKLQEAQRYLQLISKQWDNALERLRQAVEE